MDMAALQEAAAQHRSVAPAGTDLKQIGGHLLREVRGRTFDHIIAV
jgi:hypothetical protein